MPKTVYVGPCITCGGTSLDGRYRKQMCKNCYSKAKRRERGLQQPGNPAYAGPCVNCGATTSSSGRFIKRMCYPCYKRDSRGGSIMPLKKYPGPCVICGSTDPQNGQGRFIRKMCRPCYRMVMTEASVHPPNERLHGAANELTREGWRRVLEAYSYHCAYCHEPCGDNLTMDHVIPLSKGGRHHISNVVPACLECNGRKGDGPPPHPVFTLSE